MLLLRYKKFVNKNHAEIIKNKSFILLTFLAIMRNIVMKRGHYNGTFIYFFGDYYRSDYSADCLSGAQSGYKKH